MKTNLNSNLRFNDYSLVGKDTALAIERGLNNARWYATPIPRQKMRELLERRDGPAIRDTLLWFALLLLFGGAGYLLWGSWWAILPFAVYGVLYASVSDSRWHETSHGTAFKTDWMNNALYELASFMVLRESVVWRWSHTRHHSDTLIVGLDPEISAMRPIRLMKIFLNIFNIRAMRRYIHDVFLHCFGRFTAEERTYIPQSEFSKAVLRARIYVLVYTAVIGLAIYTRSLLPLMYIGLPSFFGAWLMVVYGLTQHAGLAENVLDHRLNTRTVYMDAIHRFLYWNMGYHLEHHMFPLVPYHALPKLHELVKHDTPPPYHGIIDAYREIIPTLLRQRKDPYYYIQRPLPPPSAQSIVSEPAMIAQPTPDGWWEVCDSALLLKEDVLRFDYEHKTYAIYRTRDDQYYATDGLCTHGNAHLADGMVKGNLIECAKHNGRFDVRDGSPQRLPVCVGLKTYPVRQVGRMLQVNLSAPAGFGLAQAQAARTFRVVSNENVATYIKELILEPVAGEALPEYQPGDYLQFDIPAYPEQTLQEVQVAEEYLPEWRALGVFDLKAANPTPARRNYSMAGNPAKDRTLRFNVRLATPPRGVDCYAGVGSSYLFTLKPGDAVTALGPFGEFHLVDADRELVYLGGGSGMAPLRSHISHLLETRKTAVRISYWYGARSLKELFYQEYFQNLVREYANFSFHVALSEPKPEDQWKSHTGFIHEVLQREYLNQHPNPQSIEYFLCGPPAMIQAANRMLRDMGVPAEQIHFDEF